MSMIIIFIGALKNPRIKLCMIIIFIGTFKNPRTKLCIHQRAPSQQVTGKGRETMTDSTKVTAPAASLPNSVGDLTAQELQGLTYLH